MAEKVKEGAWRHQAAIIYKRAGGAYADDETIGWAGGHDEASKICKAHNEEIEELLNKNKDTAK